MVDEMTEAQPKFVGMTVSAAEAAVDLIFIPIFQEDESPGISVVPGLDDATEGWIASARKSGEFRGKLYEFFLVRVVRGWKSQRVALVGAGKRSEATPERLRRVAAACGYTARLRNIGSIAFLIREGLDLDMAAAAAADGLSAAEFDSGSYKKERDGDGVFPSSLMIVAPGADQARLESAVRRGRIVGDAANRARELANEPGNVLTPAEFADRVATLGRAAGLAVDVLDEARIRELKMGLLLGVAQGSAQPPRLVVLKYEPKGRAIGSGSTLALVGKGVTFDTGGISIKPAENMDRMKDDMSGGAAVAAAMCAIAALGGSEPVLGLIPMAENMPGGKAIRPGDVLTAASGTTVEITNTDAEGRLILADALWYAQQLGATHLIDIATLTGACMVALGKTAAGLMGAPDSWVDTVRGAAHRGGDRVWPLPLFDEYREQLKSEIADIINAAGRGAGAITAAWFLKEFVPDKPWVHLDIAGTAWSEERKAYQPKGATGTAVRTLVELGLQKH